MVTLGLGIDTGGTYTDAVIMDLDGDVVMSRSKSLTTREDLSIGIKGAISGLDPALLPAVETVSLSSTLATNSIVEGRGCRVALVCMGSQPSGALGVDYSITVSGSFSPTGKEIESLDEDTVRGFLISLVGKVDAVAISGFMSVRNPDHERRVRMMVGEILHVPAVCGHELSSSLGFGERALTCVMNARLIPIIAGLLESVDRVMSDFGIDAPLMIVKGDGSVMGRDVAMERPIETILSGPASSINGARRLSGLDDAVVVDIGGTTTDIGVIRGGRPRLDPEGAMIGGRRTRVMAAEITTAGLGGDSRIILNGRKLTLARTRVVPLCVASSQYPSLGPRLRMLCENPPVPIQEAHYERNIIMDTEFFIKVRDIPDDSFSDMDRLFMEYISAEPHSLLEARRDLREQPISFDIGRMEGLGLIQRIGVTPTDVMHVRGTFGMYDSEASFHGLSCMARRIDASIEDLMDRIDSMVVERIAREIVGKVIYEDTGETELSGFGTGLLEKSVTGGHGTDYDVAITLNKPIIGLGGPVSHMLPEVARRLGTELVIPEDHDVGNAVGAVTGMVEESIEMLIQPAAGSRLSDPACTVFSRLGRFYIGSYSEGVDFAIRTGSEYVRDLARRAGAADATVSVDRHESAVTVGSEHNMSTISEMTLVITARGRPSSRSSGI